MFAKTEIRYFSGRMWKSVKAVSERFGGNLLFADMLFVFTLFLQLRRHLKGIKKATKKPAKLLILIKNQGKKEKWVN